MQQIPQELSDSYNGLTSRIIDVKGHKRSSLRPFTKEEDLRVIERIDYDL